MDLSYLPVHPMPGEQMERGRKAVLLQQEVPSISTGWGEERPPPHKGLEGGWPNQPPTLACGTGRLLAPGKLWWLQLGESGRGGGTGTFLSTTGSQRVDVAL